MGRGKYLAKCVGDAGTFAPASGSSLSLNGAHPRARKRLAGTTKAFWMATRCSRFGEKTEPSRT